jgi:hypothetical protein
MLLVSFYEGKGGSWGEGEGEFLSRCIPDRPFMRRGTRDDTNVRNGTPLSEFPKGVLVCIPRRECGVYRYLTPPRALASHQKKHRSFAIAFERSRLVPERKMRTGSCLRRSSLIFYGRTETVGVSGTGLNILKSDLEVEQA